MQNQNRRITAIVAEHGARVRSFLRRRLFGSDAVEEVLQEVFVELVESFRLGREVEEIGAWLMTVAKHRVIDRFRHSATRQALEAQRPAAADDAGDWLDLLPSPDAGPDAQIAQDVLLDELAAAVDELPAEQAEVFIAHELLGKSFKDMAQEQGLPVNTLLSRKHSAVKFLRGRLANIRLEMTDS